MRGLTALNRGLGVLCSWNNHYKCHFKNDCRGNYFHYGDEYISNKLIVTPFIDLCYYNPFNSCSSAQMIIVKEE